MRANPVPATGNRKGKKNIPEATKFAILNMVNTEIRQIDVANHFRISKSVVSVKKKRGRKHKVNAAAVPKPYLSPRHLQARKRCAKIHLE